ncbi:MAG: sulfatase [Acidobacteria bacterium]|nr:sulfatase [Acidobacteriota bacterium]MBI3424790.1 sulfatase [Acidobacteriota bacterium]
MQSFINSRAALVLIALCVCGWLMPARQTVAKRPPNFVIIFADDLGYADIGSFGAKGYQTPNLDRMAREGVRLTNFYVAQAVCSASRTALLTGCYPNRVSILGALNHTAQYGINASEMLIPEVLKAPNAGTSYASAIFGKWHLGHHPQFLPTHNGFDEYFGLPYSNDMWPKNPAAVGINYPDLPLYEGDQVIKRDPDQTQLTTWYTEHAVSFIERHKDQPFFLYVPHSMPHVPLFVSDKFKGKSGGGLYGDVIAEIDWSVGQILAALKRLNLDNNTLVIFTSDNGPWHLYGDHGGSAGPLRGYKATMFEGGVREPFIARWPGHIKAGSVNQTPAMTIDLLPTLAKLAGAAVPTDRIIDGRDIWPLLSGNKSAQPPHEVLYFYWGRELQAVRSGKWKLHLPHPYVEHIPANGGERGKVVSKELELSLFDLEKDQGETTNVAAQQPAVVKRLLEYAEQARADLGDSLTKREGKNVRPAGQLAAAAK